MLYELTANLGLIDARKCNTSFGATLSLDANALKQGAAVELPKEAAAYLTNPKQAGGRGYSGLLKPAGNVKGEAKSAELKAPAK